MILPFDAPYAAVSLRPLTSMMRTQTATMANNCVASQMQLIASAFPGTGQITFAAPPSEATLRFPSAIAHGLATLIATGQHQAATTGYTDVQVTATAVRLISSFAASHAANGGNWGGEPISAGAVVVSDSSTYQWQGAYWVSLAATAARLLWTALSSSQQAAVDAMVKLEADRFLNYTVPYMRNASGAVVTAGDTKAEENAWNAAVLYLAAGSYPGHAHAVTWLRKATELSLSSTATSAFPTSRLGRNGLCGWILKGGSNIEFSGFVENHGFPNPNYVCALSQNWINGLTFAWLRRQVVPSATLCNATLVYRALVDIPFLSPPMNSPGGSAYTASSASIYYPSGNDGDSAKQTVYATFDGLAYLIRGDATSSVRADTWHGLHATQELALQTSAPGSYATSYDLQQAAVVLLADWTIQQGTVTGTSDSPVEQLLV